MRVSDQRNSKTMELVLCFTGRTETESDVALHPHGNTARVRFMHQNQRWIDGTMHY